MRLNGRLIGKNRDVPIAVSVTVPAATAGTGTDFEQDLFTVPVLTGLYASGLAGLAPVNSVKVKTINLLPSGATLTGVATNNFTLNIRQWRGGVALGIIGSVTFGVGTNLAPHTALEIVPLNSNKFLPGDVLTIQRVSAGTGLASPAFLVQPDWTEA